MFFAVHQFWLQRGHLNCSFHHIWKQTQILCSWATITFLHQTGDVSRMQHVPASLVGCLWKMAALVKHTLKFVLYGVKHKYLKLINVFLTALQASPTGVVGNIFLICKSAHRTMWLQVRVEDHEAWNPSDSFVQAEVKPAGETWDWKCRSIWNNKQNEMLKPCLLFLLDRCSHNAVRFYTVG